MEEYDGELNRLLQEEEEGDNQSSSSSSSSFNNNNGYDEIPSSSHNLPSNDQQTQNEDEEEEWYNFDVTFGDGSLGMRITKDEFGRAIVTKINFGGQAGANGVQVCLF